MTPDEIEAAEYDDQEMIDDWEMCDDDDPNEERYCMYCNTYLPPQCFTSGGDICNDCLDERRYGPCN